MSDLVVSMTVGSEVEGLRVDASLVGQLFPSGTTQEALEALREHVKMAVFLRLVLAQGESFEGAANLVDRKTSTVG